MARAVRKKSSSRASNKSKRRTTRSTRTAVAKSNKPSAPSYFNEFCAIVFFAAAVFFFAALCSHILGRQELLNIENLDTNLMGSIGGTTAAGLVALFGYCSFAVSLLFLLASRLAWQLEKDESAKSFLSTVKTFSVFAVLLLSLATIASVFWATPGGGLVGDRLAAVLVSYFNTAGAILFSLLVSFLTLVAVTELSFGSLLKFALLVSEFAKTLIEHLFSFGMYLGQIVKDAVSEIWEEVRIQWNDRHRESEQHASCSKKQLTAVDTKKRSKKSRDVFVLGTEKDLDSEPEQAPNVRLVQEVQEDLEDDLDNESVAELAEVKILRRDPNAVARVRKSAAVPQRPALENYENPSLDLLVGTDANAASGPDDQLLIENSKSLEEALKNFRIGGRVVEVHPGPVVTLYQFAPAPGIKVQRIINLADDLALALKVASVRVYAPVPGKGTVGVEVPNRQREIVRLRDVLECEEYSVHDTPLPLALGKDTYGEPFVAPLPRMPHLLIAGATGTGKSVCINSLLLSLLCKNSPADLNLILIDPKMLELSVYEDIPHLKAPVVTNAKRARGVLWWAVEEMERRYRLLKEVGVRDVAAYNRLSVDSQRPTNDKKKRKNVTIELLEHDVVATGSSNEGLDRTYDSTTPDQIDAPAVVERLPRIVVVVDELADLMLSVGREIEDLLARLAQKARAAGIHLILATQRPSVNVITGLIKANFPARISFKVASKIDARTVLDTSGSEKLLGQGDMLFLAPWLGQLKRLHSPYVSDQEVHDVCDWLRSQGSPMYDGSIEQMISKMEQNEGGSSAGIDGNGEEYDEFYDRAVSLVVEKGQASTSMVQRAFRIGYNRAARILETMEREGIVGPADGARPRKILVGSIEIDDEL